MTDTDDTEERWLPIPGHPHYELSDQGRVRSWVDWPGRTSPLPNILRGASKGGRWRVQLGRGNLHSVDDLMNRTWGAPNVVPLRLPTRWRRLMLTESNHEVLVRVLELIDSPVAGALLVRIRAAKRVVLGDPIHPDELTEEG